MEQKTIVITGSSTGIGRAAAEHFAAQGWRVAATMRRPEASDLAGENITLYPLDVTDESQVNETATTILKDFGHVDVVVNNAGYGLLGAFEGMNTDHIQRQFDTNVFGLMRVTQAFIPAMRERGSGLFINISSVGGRTTFPLISPYHATKWAVEGFSESLHYELLPLGIGVKLVEPGAIATDFGSRSMEWVDTEIDAYGPVSTTIRALFSTVEYSAASLVAEKIFEAATDETLTMRYPVGPDAEQTLARRKEIGDEAFLAEMRQMVQPVD